MSCKKNIKKKTKFDKTEYILSDKDTNAKDGVISDPQGSYTGVAVNKKDKPVQDADDL